MAGTKQLGIPGWSEEFSEGGNRCTIVLHNVQHPFSRKANIFSRGLVPPVVMVLCSGTKWESNVLPHQATVYIEQVIKNVWIKLAIWRKMSQKHLSSVEYSFIESNLEDIHAVPYFLLATSISAKRRLALRIWLRTYSWYAQSIISFERMKTYLVVLLCSFWDSSLK